MMNFVYLVFVILAAASAATTTFQSILTAVFRRRRRQVETSILPAGRFRHAGAFHFDPEAALRTR